jgi:Tol biopolymer transport system component
MKKTILCLLLIGLIFPASAQENKGLMPLDVAKIKRVAEVMISYDGETIAYLLHDPADPLKENKPANIELYVYRVNEKLTVPFLTRNRVSDVAFRPGHESITFLAKLEDDENQSVYEIPLSGGEAVKLFSFKTSISDYHWASDGEKVVFIAEEEKDKKEEDKLPYQPNVYEEDLTWDYGWVASVSNPDAAQKINVTGHFHNVRWSPDGSKLAVAVAPTPLVDDLYMKQSVRIVDAETLNETGLVDHPGKLGMMAFSPDEEKLAFIGGADIHDPIAGRLFVVDSSGGKPESLRPDY